MQSPFAQFFVKKSAPYCVFVQCGAVFLVTVGYNFLRQVCYVATAVVAHKGVLLGTGRTHLLATLGANAVVVGVDFVVASVAFHTRYLSA